MAGDPEFDRFWQAFPRKKSKGDAFKAWQQLKNERPPIMDVLKALAVLKASPDWQKEGGRFIPYPATWLRAWGWADVPEIDLADVRGDVVWWLTVSGVESKAKEIGMEWDATAETFQMFAERVRKAAQALKVVPIKGGEDDEERLAA